MTATSPTPATPTADMFYDARRGVYYAKPMNRGRLHCCCSGSPWSSARCSAGADPWPGWLSSSGVYAVSVVCCLGRVCCNHVGTC